LFNTIHSLLHDPSRGWDPISAEYAASYRDVAHIDMSVVDRFESAVGGLRGRGVIDVGSGPGHYAHEFARRGADVTCLDISANYLRMAESRLREDGLSAKYVAGYIDHINRLTPGSFDAVFSNVAWCYCMNDFSFARELLRAVKPGGTVFTRQTNETWDKNPSLKRRIAYLSNRSIGLKIGHTHPPVGRIARAFEKLGNCTVRSEPVVEAAEIVIVTRER
jgi:2-polyprenyl-3-methyl-5-hydroxy-6-metoxy-1,4-benzoquinol methylase